MCGIAGIIQIKPKPISFETIKSYFNLLKANGEQACGIGTVNENLDIQYIKAVCSPEEFLTKYKKKLNSLLKDNTKVLLMHTRQPSNGSNDILNAQPIVIKDTMLTHNGTIVELGSWSKNNKRSDSYKLARKIAASKNTLKALEVVDSSNRVAFVKKDKFYLYLSVATKLMYDFEKERLAYSNSGFPMTSKILGLIPYTSNSIVTEIDDTCWVFDLKTSKYKTFEIEKAVHTKVYGDYYGYYR